MLTRYRFTLLILALLGLHQASVQANKVRQLRKRELFDVIVEEKLEENDLMKVWQEGRRQLATGGGYEPDVSPGEGSKDELDAGEVTDSGPGKGGKSGSKKGSKSGPGKGGKSGSGSKSSKGSKRGKAEKKEGSGKGTKKYTPEPVDSVDYLMSMSMEYRMLF